MAPGRICRTWRARDRLARAQLAGLDVDPRILPAGLVCHERHPLPVRGHLGGCLELQIPCMQDASPRKWVFFYGHLDVARDSKNPALVSTMREALVLAHVPGRMSHPEGGFDFDPDRCGMYDMTTRPIDRCTPDAHDTTGFFVIAPGSNFTRRPRTPRRASPGWWTSSATTTPSPACWSSASRTRRIGW